MKILQKTEFKKAYKKLHKNQLPVVNAENSKIGVEKVGDLKGIFVTRRSRKFLSKCKKYFEVKKKFPTLAGIIFFYAACL